MKKYLQNKVTKVTLGVVILLTLFFLMLPIGVSFFITNWLEKNGAQSASIETFRLNPFLGRLTIRGLNVAGVEDELLKHSNLVIDFGLSSLFQHNLRIEQAEYNDLYIDIRQKEDGSWRYGSITVKKGDDSTEVSEPQPDKPWGLGADNVLLKNCRATLHTPEFTLELLIDHAELQGFSTSRSEKPGTLTLNGTLNGSPISLDIATLQISPQLEIDGTINVGGFPLHSIAGSVREIVPKLVGNASLDGSLLIRNAKAEGLLAQYDGTLTLDRNNLGTTTLTADAETISWKGLLSYFQAGTNGTGAKLQGQLLAEKVSLSLPESELELQQGKIALGTTTDITLGKTMTVTNSGSLNLENLDISLPQLTLVGRNFLWDGSIDLDSADPQKVNANGKIIVDKLQFETSGTDALDVSIDSITLAELNSTHVTNFTIGSLRAQQLACNLPGALPLNIRLDDFQLSQAMTEGRQHYRAAEMELSGINATSAISGDPLGNLASLAFHNISTSTAPSFSAEAVTATSLFLLGTKDDASVALKSAEMQDINWSSMDGLHSTALTLDSLHAAILLKETGQINISEQLSVMKSPTEESVQNTDIPETERSAAPIQIGEITLTGDSRVTFADQTLAVPYATSLVIDRLLISDLDSTRQEKQLTLQFDGNIEKRAPLTIAGDLSPFKEPPAINLDLTLKNYPLSSISPYTVQSVGTALAGGRMKVASSIELIDNHLDLKNKVLLEKLQTNTISEELATELDNQLPVPLDAALSMLRDSKGNIELAIPLSGPIDQLRVGISDILVKALSKSIVSATSSYFIYALGPYAALAYVGMKVGEEMLRIDLPPVQFNPSEKELTSEHLDYLERIATILKERPETDLQLTPLVTSGEITTEMDITRENTAQKPVEKAKEHKTKEEAKETTELRQQLIELGQQRATVIQDYLIQTHSIDRSRLLISSTSIQDREDAQPTVTIEVK